MCPVKVRAPSGKTTKDTPSFSESFACRMVSSTFTGHMGYFKKGAFQLADDLQLAVVPVTIDGSFEILPRTGKWIHRHRMILTIHDPIPPKGKGMENIKATMAEAYAAVESALPEKHKGMITNEDQDR